MQPLPRATSAAVAAALNSRRAELEDAIHRRVRNGAEDRAAADAVVRRAAISATVAYALAGIEQTEPADEPVPDAVTAYARRAAREGIPLDALVCSFHICHTLLGDLIVEEVERQGFTKLRRVLRIQGELFERVFARTAAIYADEIARPPPARPAGTRRARQATARRRDGRLSRAGLRPRCLALRDCRDGRWCRPGSAAARVPARPRPAADPARGRVVLVLARRPASPVAVGAGARDRSG